MNEHVRKFELDAQSDRDCGHDAWQGEAEERKQTERAVALQAQQRTQADANAAFWAQIDKRIYDLWWPGRHDPLLEAVGDVFGQERQDRRDAIAELNAQWTAELKEARADVQRNAEQVVTLQRELADAGRDIAKSLHRIIELEASSRLEKRFHELAERQRRKAIKGPAGPE